MKDSLQLSVALALAIIMIGAGTSLEKENGTDSLHIIEEAGADSSDVIEIAGWIPHWRAKDGAGRALEHLDTLTTIHPFAYSVKSDGTLLDTMKIEAHHWQELFLSAREKNVKVIPTVMSGDGAAMHRLLTDDALRTRHIESIVSAVNEGGFDGIDIDYESKKKETRDHFSLFLKELKSALGHKLLTCAIEARTPPDSLYKVIPQNLEYSTDLDAVARYCDVVEIMTYDQQRADLKQNAVKTDAPYSPVSDAGWVRKVIDLALLSIPPDKIMLGVPTYGREYEIIAHPNGYLEHKRLRALNQGPALSIAQEHRVIPGRSRAGERDFSYVRNSSAFAGFNGHVVAEKALAHAKNKNKAVKFNYVTWSDSAAIAEKAALAREYGLRGIAIFKVDGEEDPNLWTVLETAGTGGQF